VPLYMDRHEFAKVTAEDLAAAHLQDLAVQGRFGVQFLNYWFDEARQTAFCLATGPSGDAVSEAHAASHGIIPHQVIEVDPDAVGRFMGGMANHKPGEPYVETAFRTILFTDIEGSTRLTQELGDARAMAVLRNHDLVVRDALQRNVGSEVKHTGDGVMAAFRSVTGAIEAAMEIQRRISEVDATIPTPVQVRVGIAAGEPVNEGGDLFGAAVQLAARLCQRATPGTILVSAGVHDLALGKGFSFGKAGRFRLKGFDEQVIAFEVGWDASRETAPKRERAAKP
jgi:class 3 adenylate cyclase